MVPRSTKFSTCVECKMKKKKCSVKGIVKRLVASGKLGVANESANLEISNKEDIIALGLERGAEVILLQLISFQQEMNERLEMIKVRLDVMERGMEGNSSDDMGSEGLGSGGDGEGDPNEDDE